MKTAIVVITHNRPHKLRELLESIKKHTKYDHNIYVLDNATEQTGAAFIKNIKHGYNFNLFRSDDNLYPGKARNLLFEKLIDEDYVVTLDDDMLVTKNWLEPLLALYESTSMCAGVGPIIIQEGLKRVHSQGGYCVIDDKYITFKEHLRMQPYRKLISELECDWLASGCSLYSREIIGKFRFNNDMPCMEDPAHSYDITRAGYKLMSTPKSVVMHTAGVPANRDMRNNNNLIKSICIFHEKYGLNPIKSWDMHTRLLRGHSDIDVVIEVWLLQNKVKFGVISQKEMIANMPSVQKTSGKAYNPGKKAGGSITADSTQTPRNRTPLSSRYQYIKKKKY